MSQSATRRRFPLIDLLRGVAILAMVVFHVAWDLYYYGFIGVDPTSDLGWVIFQKAILSSFLLLTGGSLVLGHGKGIRWPSFWRRFAIIGIAALLTTAGTYAMFPDFFVFFGVLHAIAAFSLLGLAFLFVPTWLVLLAAAAVIIPHFLFAHQMFIDKRLAWIGFWTESPWTTDIVPVFPWFGVVLLGIAGMRIWLGSKFSSILSDFVAPRGTRWLAVAGRWSLIIYLLHQPLLLGGLGLLAQMQPPVVMPEVTIQP
jgi:uncharacterized membrane protein